MNRLYKQFRLGLEYRIIDLFVRATIGAAGAPTLVAAASKGVASISRVSAGLYNITLQDKYVDLYDVKCSIVLAAGSPGVLPSPIIRSVAVATTKVVQIAFLDAAFAAADPANGCTLRLEISLKGSTI